MLSQGRQGSEDGPLCIREAMGAVPLVTHLQQSQQDAWVKGKEGAPGRSQAGSSQVPWGGPAPSPRVVAVGLCRSVPELPSRRRPLFCPWDSPGKNTGVICHYLLQGIFPT